MTERVPDWAQLVRDATRDAAGHLYGVAGLDWSVRAGDLRWSCWTTAAHVADDLFAYAAQVAGQPQDRYLPFQMRVETGAPPSGVVSVIEAGGELLAQSVATAGPDVRAWHPWGMTDASGFAAMGITEILVHAYDIGQGLGVTWPPPDALAGATVTRLFPDAPPWRSDAEALLWCAGRIPLGDRPRRPSDWRWDATVR